MLVSRASPVRPSGRVGPAYQAPRHRDIPLSGIPAQQLRTWRYRGHARAERPVHHLAVPRTRRSRFHRDQRSPSRRPRRAAPPGRLAERRPTPAPGKDPSERIQRTPYGRTQHGTRRRGPGRHGVRRPRRRRAGTGLSAMVLPELKKLASDLGITGVTGMRKSQLIAAIQEKQGGGQEQGSAGASREPLPRRPSAPGGPAPRPPSARSPTTRSPSPTARPPPSRPRPSRPRSPPTPRARAPRRRSGPTSRRRPSGRTGRAAASAVTGRTGGYEGRGERHGRDQGRDQNGEDGESQGGGRDHGRDQQREQGREGGGRQRQRGGRDRGDRGDRNDRGDRGDRNDQGGAAAARRPEPGRRRPARRPARR